MLLEVEVSTEALAANLAGEGLFIIVCVHVEGQVVYLMESFRTNGTFVRLFAAVCQFVVLVVALLVEALAAIFADEGFVAGVDAGVCI